MALSITEPTAEATDTTDGTSYASLTAYTPAANSLQLVFVFAAGTVAQGSMTGGSLTWERLARLPSGAGSTLYIFMAQAGASPASCDPTFDCTGDAATGVVMSVLEVTGHNQSYPIRQIAAAAANASNPSCPFAKALLTGNAYAMAIGVNRTAPAYTPFTSSTETCDTGHSSPNSGMELAYRVNGTTSTSLSATGASGNYAALAIEINDASNTTVLSMGTNFRDSSTFATDGTDEYYNLAEVYPVFRGPFPDGWTDGLGGDRSRDRNASLDRRLAGGNFTNSTGSQDRVTIYQRDLPCAGTWRIRFSLGDPDNARTGQKAEIFDDTTSKGSVTDASTASGAFVDASGVERSSASDWVNNNVAVDVTFATKKFVLKTGTSSAGSTNTFLGHVNLEFVPPSANVTGTVAQSKAAASQSSTVKLSNLATVAQSISAPSQAVTERTRNYSESVVQSIGAASQSIAATHHHVGALAQSISAASQSTSVKLSNLSTVAQAIGAASTSVSATHHSVAAIAQSIGAPSQAAAGALHFFAAVGQTLGACSQSIAAKQTVSAAAAQSIGAPSQSVVGVVPYTSTITQAIGAPSQAVVAELKAQGVIAQSIGAPTQSLTGLVPYSGTIAQTKSPATQSASVDVANPNRNGQIAQVLSPPTQAADVTLRTHGTASQTLSAGFSSATGRLSHGGTLAQHIGPAAQSAALRLSNRGATAQSIGAPAQAAAVTSHIVGAASASIGACSSSAVAALRQVAAVTQSIHACINAIEVLIGVLPAEPYFVYRVQRRGNVESAKNRETVVSLSPANVVRVEREKL